jgi:4-amino-4-deoxy-L-arabinose transferase-like glycosyltransferase
LAVAYLIGVWVQNFDGVYLAWDSWASWDRWAEKWADNRFPGDTWEYPQMIPVLLSISYKFIGTVAVKFFGKSIMPLFALLIVCLLIDLGRRYRSYGYMAGAVLAFYSIDLFLSKYYAEVYVDIPVAALSLLVVYTVLVARQARSRQELQTYLLLGALSSAAAGVTKQTGLYLLAFYPVFCYLWVLRPKRVPFREAFVLLGRNLLLALLIVVPWYAYIEYGILTGQRSSNIDYVISDIYRGQTHAQRFIAAVESLRGYAYWFVFLGISLLVLPREFLQLAIFVIIPFSVLWAVFLSYEHRNLAVVFPLLSMTVGIGFESWVEQLAQFVRRRKVKLVAPAFTGLLLALVIVAAATPVFDSEALVSRQLTEQRKIIEPLLNQKLYTYFARTGGPQPVITNYPIGWLPDLRDVWVVDRFDNLQTFEDNLTSGIASLLLIPSTAINQEILNFVQQRLDDGTYELIFSEANYRLIRLDEQD